MKEVTRYNDGMGCTRRQLVDNILIAISQSRAAVAAPQGEDDTAYNADAMLRLRQEVIGEVERERLVKASPWVRSLVNELVQRIYNLRRMVAPAKAASPCDFRKPECSDQGVTVGGKWVCNNHLSASPVSPSLIPPFCNEEGEQQTVCANCTKPIIKSGDKWIHKYGWMKECVSDKIVATPAATSPSLIPEQEPRTREIFDAGFAAATPTAAVQGVLELLDAALLHPEKAEGYIRQVIEMLSVPTTATSGAREAAEEIYEFVNVNNMRPSVSDIEAIISRHFAVPVEEQPEGELPIEDLERDHYRDHPPDAD